MSRTPTKTASAWKSLHGKLSRKISELILVIHVLFRKNHEKELELEYVSDLYEKELDNCIQIYTTKIDALEGKLEEFQKYRRNTAVDIHDMEQLKTAFSELEVKYCDAQQIIEQMRSEANQLRDKISVMDNLANEDSDICRGQSETVHANVDSCELQQENQQLLEEMKLLRKSHAKELQRIQNEKAKLKDRLSTYGQAMTKEIEELKASLDTISKEQFSERERHAKIVNDKNNLIKENRKLVNDNNHLRIKLQNYQAKLGEVVQSERKKSDLPALGSNYQSSSVSRDEEVQKLQDEVERYRKELMNREDNYNRVFKDKNPVVMFDTSLHSQSRVNKGTWNLTGVNRRGSRKGQLPSLSTTHFGVTPHTNPDFTQPKW